MINKETKTKNKGCAQLEPMSEGLEYTQGKHVATMNMMTQVPLYLPINF